MPGKRPISRSAKTHKAPLIPTVDSDSDSETTPPTIPLSKHARKEYTTTPPNTEERTVAVMRDNKLMNMVSSEIVSRSFIKNGECIPWGETTFVDAHGYKYSSIVIEDCLLFGQDPVLGLEQSPQKFQTIRLGVPTSTLEVLKGLLPPREPGVAAMSKEYIAVFLKVKDTTPVIGTNGASVIEFMQRISNKKYPSFTVDVEVSVTTVGDAKFNVRCAKVIPKTPGKVPLDELTAASADSEPIQLSDDTLTALAKLGY